MTAPPDPDPTIAPLARAIADHNAALEARLTARLDDAAERFGPVAVPLKQAATLLGISYTVAKELNARGEMAGACYPLNPGVKGSSVLCDVARLRRWSDQRAAAAQAEHAATEAARRVLAPPVALQRRRRTG